MFLWGRTIVLYEWSLLFYLSSFWFFQNDIKNVFLFSVLRVNLYTSFCVVIKTKQKTSDVESSCTVESCHVLPADVQAQRGGPPPPPSSSSSSRSCSVQGARGAPSVFGGMETSDQRQPWGRRRDLCRNAWRGDGECIPRWASGVRTGHEQSLDPVCERARHRVLRPGVAGRGPRGKLSETVWSRSLEGIVLGSCTFISNRAKSKRCVLKKKKFQVVGKMHVFFISCLVLFWFIDPKSVWERKKTV